MYHHDSDDVIHLREDELNRLLLSDNDTDWDNDPYYCELVALTQAIELWQVSDDRSTPECTADQALLDWEEIAAQMTVIAKNEFRKKPYTALDCRFMWVQWVNPHKEYIKGETLITEEDEFGTRGEVYDETYVQNKPHHFQMARPPPDTKSKSKKREKAKEKQKNKMDVAEMKVEEVEEVEAEAGDASEGTGKEDKARSKGDENKEGNDQDDDKEDDTVWEDYDREEEDPKSKEPLKYCFYPEEPTLVTRLSKMKVSYPDDLQYPDEVKILSNAYFGGARRRSRKGVGKGEKRAYRRPKSFLGNIVLRNPMCYVKNTDDSKGWKNFDFIAKQKQVEKEDYDAMLAQEAIDNPQAAIDRAAAAAAAQQAQKRKPAVKRKKKEPPKEKALPVTFDELMAVSEIAKAPVKVTDNW